MTTSPSTVIHPGLSDWGDYLMILPPFLHLISSLDDSLIKSDQKSKIRSFGKIDLIRILVWFNTEI